MKAKTTNNKASAKKKLIPAAGSLAISAVMLASSTYAWFTMSREVEVKNIQVTATTPEDIQISLGTIKDHSTEQSLITNTSYLTADGDGKATNPTADFDWSNTADISHYYSFGRLIPASSDTGASIFFTPDANGIGQTVKTDAKYYQAASGTTAIAETAVGGSGTGALNATSHIITGNSDTWSGTRADSWKHTSDDGYYIDIPVWLRTSSTKDTDISVKAYVVDKTTVPEFGTDYSGTTTGKELYRAVRVAILKEDGTQAGENGNLIPVADGTGSGTESGDSYAGPSILDWYTAGSGTAVNPYTVHGGAVSSISDQGGTSTYTPIATLQNNAAKGTYKAGEKVATLAHGDGRTYGDYTKLWIRIWLEGEDQDCYNETAGQDWSINLMFNNETTNPTPTS